MSITLLISICFVPPKKHFAKILLFSKSEVSKTVLFPFTTKKYTIYAHDWVVLMTFRLNGQMYY